MEGGRWKEEDVKTRDAGEEMNVERINRGMSGALLCFFVRGVVQMGILYTLMPKALRHQPWNPSGKG